MKRIVRFGYLFLVIFLFSKCQKDNNLRKANSFIEDQSIIQDQYGRQLILHGLNTSSSAKSDPERQPWIIESDVEREANEFGFNFVRYLIFWDAIEPQRDVFDDAYLDKVEEKVNWYTSKGMYVMLDMHQDIYSILFGGDGAPEWAVETNGHPINNSGSGPWWLKNIDPAVIASWTNFWSYTNHKHLQDHYIMAWQKVMERFKNNPFVIGYDLMNEPWGGDLIKIFITGEFEKQELTSFYNRIIPVLRTIDNNKYFFFEPTPAPVTFGAASHLQTINDARAGNKKLVYAPHCYPVSLHEGNDYSSGDKKNLKDWNVQRQKDVQTHGNIPLLCGEFGVSPNALGFDEYLTEVLAMFDSHQWNWAYWSNDKGGWSPLDANRNETPIVEHLVRVYPKAVAGKIEAFNFDPIQKIFTLKYTNYPNIAQPTEIFIPKRFFPNGYDLEIVSGNIKSTSYNETNQTLSIDADQYETIEIIIK